MSFRRVLQSAKNGRRTWSNDKSLQETKPILLAIIYPARDGQGTQATQADKLGIGREVRFARLTAAAARLRKLHSGQPKPAPKKIKKETKEPITHKHPGK